MSLIFSKNRADSSDIAQHLLTCDTSFHPPLSSVVDPIQYAKKLADHAACFEAWFGSELIGLVALYCNDSERVSAFVSNVSVSPKYTGRGLAKHLMLSCIDHASELGFAKVSLKVDSSAQTAFRLYEGLGFHVEKSQTTTQITMVINCLKRVMPS